MQSDDLFRNVADLLQDSDICFGNLESVLSDNGEIEKDIKSFQMRGAPGIAKSLRNAGFNIMSVANNHAMQHGDEAFYETCAVMLREGIQPLGIRSNGNRTVPVRLVVNGCSVALLGYSLRPEKYSKNALYARVPVDQIIHDIETQKADNDIVIVSLHWGDEFVRVPSPKQVKAGHAFVEAGASLIIGHHPHILQGVERYRNSIIAYSLGNFIFDFWQKKYRDTAILQCELSGRGVEECKVTPAQIGKNYCINQVVGEKAKCMHAMLDRLSEKISHIDLDSKRQLSKYESTVKYALIINQIENRMFFFRNIFKYQNWVVKQSLANFISCRYSSKA
jgi:poly-gamma-glutamate synthesis protein (capsule biosynthesis protein)